MFKSLKPIVFSNIVCYHHLCHTYSTSMAAFIMYCETGAEQIHQDHLTGTALVTTEAGEAAGMMKYFPFVKY